MPKSTANTTKTKSKNKTPVTQAVLSNRELQNVVGQLILDIEADTKLTPSEKARDIHHAGAVHLRCTRAEIYAINSSHRGSAPTDLRTSMKMPVFKT